MLTHIWKNVLTHTTNSRASKPDPNLGRVFFFMVILYFQALKWK